MKKSRFLVLCAVVTAGLLFATGCGNNDNKNGAEAPYQDETNQKVNDTSGDGSKNGSAGEDLERTGDSLKDAGKNLMDSVEETGDAIRDGIDNLGNDIGGTNNGNGVNNAGNTNNNNGTIEENGNNDMDVIP